MGTSSKVTKFEINLEHDIDEQYQYEPGEALRGYVIMELTDTIKVQAVQVQIKGESSVSWDEESKGGPQSFQADETYIDVTQNLVQLVGGEALTLNAGKHRFPLEYILPSNLPSSFIGKFGSITYVLKATLRQAQTFGMQTMITSEPFLVLRRLDISLDEELLNVRQQKSDKRFWGAIAFCMSGKVMVTMSINKTGHLPGEDIFMDADITNDSPRVIKAVQASIIMHSTFAAKNKSRHNTQVVNKKRDEWELVMGEGRRWKGVRLTIPPYIPESRLDGCDIIDIRYELIFKVEISGKHEIHMDFPLVVGTVQGQELNEAANKGGSGVAGRIWRAGMPNANEYVKAPHDSNGKKEQHHEDMNGVAEDNVSIEMGHEEAANFRRPMDPGETRRNPLFMNQESQD